MVDITPADDPEFLRPVVKGWLGAIKKAQDAKKWFDETADQCRMFYCPRKMGAMWSEPFRSKFMSGKAPKFQIMLNKAFEYVAIMGPSLYWQNPTRELRQREVFQPKPEYFQEYGEYADIAYQMASEQLQRDLIQNEIARDLMVTALNYFPGEQPGGGLSFQSQLAVTDMLVTGRGVVWTEKYQYPGSDRTLVGSFYDSNRNLLTDPDAHMPDMTDCRWIARKHVTPRFELEKRFGLADGYLKGKGTMESWDSQGRNQSDQEKADRRAGKTFDLITWYEVWSKCGVGYKLKTDEMESIPYHDKMGDAIEKVCGDYVYLAIMQGVDWPLNAPRKEVMHMTDEQVSESFSWPTEFWMDGKWPVECLDAYFDTDYSWPIAPFAPAMGELMFLNIFISKLCSRVWSSSRDLILIAQEATAEFEAAIKDGDDLTVLPVSMIGSSKQSMKELVDILSLPDVHADVYKIIEIVSDLFDKRVGLTELLYGGNAGGVQSRSSADAQNKEKYASVRPQYMADRVDQFQVALADKEKFCAWRHVQGRDIAPLIGQYGADLWDKHISTADPELVVRNMQTTIVANSSRKPNKAKDAETLNNAFQWMVPAVENYMTQTGNVDPFNKMLEAWAKANELDITGFELQPIDKSNDPEAAAQQQQMQHEQEMQQQEAARKQQEHEMNMQSKQMDMQVQEQELGFKQAEMEMKQQEGAMKLQQQQDQHAMNMEMQADKFDMQQATNEQQLIQQDTAHKQSLQQNAQMAKAKAKQAAQKPKPGGKK